MALRILKYIFFVPGIRKHAAAVHQRHDFVCFKVGVDASLSQVTTFQINLLQ